MMRDQRTQVIDIIDIRVPPITGHLAYLCKRVPIGHTDPLVSQDHRPALRQGMTKGAREGPQVRHESSPEEYVACKVHLVIEDVLRGRRPSFLLGSSKPPLALLPH